MERPFVWTRNFTAGGNPDNSKSDATDCVATVLLLFLLLAVPTALFGLLFWGVSTLLR